MAELCSGASHSRFARPFFTSVSDLRFVEPQGSHPFWMIVLERMCDLIGVFGESYFKVAEREGLIRFAQGYAPKPVALPLSTLAFTS